MPFTSILYANGPGYVHINGTRGNITMVDYCEYKLMSFICNARLCWCGYRQRELMWLRQSHACVFLWKTKMKWWCLWHHDVFCSVLFCVQASLCTCNCSLKGCLYFFVEYCPAIIQFLPFLFCTIRFSHCMSVYTWRRKYVYLGINYLLKPLILSLWMTSLFVFGTSSCVPKVHIQPIWHLK